MRRGYPPRQIFVVCTIALLSLFFVVLSACGDGTGQNVQTTPNIVKMDASWHIHYADVKSAKHDPDLNLIVAGTVTSLKPAQNTGGIVTTDAVFTVTRIAWNPQKLPIGATISVRIPGGIIGNTRYEVDDFPMYQVGERDILFLNFDRATGIAGTLGGPSGRLLLKNGIVQPLNNEGMNIPPKTSEEAFLSSIPSA